MVKVASVYTTLGVEQNREKNEEANRCEQQNQDTEVTHILVNVEEDSLFLYYLN